MLNFRPLPGIALENGKPSLYRSGEILRLTSQECISLIVDFEIKLFIDLRSSVELIKNRQPTAAIAEGLHWLSIPIESDGDYFRTKQYPDAVDYFDYSVALLESNKAEFAAIFKIITEHKNNAIMFGCYAGKDRTGLLAVLILLHYNVPRRIIIEDYLASGPCLSNNLDYFEQNWLKKGLTKAAYNERMQPKEQTVVMLMDYIEHHYGGIAGYFNHIGF